MERLPLDFDSFFSEDLPVPDNDGLFRCACQACRDYRYNIDGVLQISDTGCMVRVIVPGDVCDNCISDCYHGQRDITR